MISNPQSKLLRWGGRTTGLVVGLAVIGALLMALLVLALPALAVPSTFTVNSTSNSNDLDFPSGDFDGTSDGLCDVNAASTGEQCTLRAAIQEANVNNNPTDQDRINFNIQTGTGLNKTITPTGPSPLPRIQEPVIIDGYSQPGSSVNTLPQGTNGTLRTDAILRIQLNGTNLTTDDGLEINASNTVVKGLVINRFGGRGIRTDASGDADFLTNVRIEGNFIGTNMAGTSALGNSGGVLLISGTTNSTVGGTSRASRNLISGNENSGVAIESAERNKVQGNLIGTKRDGTSALGNEFDGVVVFNDSVGNSILSNSIFANGVGGDEGIDLGADGPTPNDEGDTDTGGNRLQNFPELSSATSISGTTTVEGTLNSRPKEPYTIQFFSSPPAGVGETVQGQTFIGSKTVFTNASGDATFTFTRSTAVEAGRQITATATRQATGDTSGFSAAQEIPAS